MRKKLAFAALLLPLLMIVSGCGQELVQSTSTTTNATTGSGAIVQAYNAVKAYFLYSENIPSKYDLYSGASLEAILLADFGSTEGFVNSLGDPHTRYYAAGKDPVDSALGAGTYGGVGIIIRGIEGKLAIYYVLPGQPADLAGVKRGDEIVAIDGTVVASLGTEEAANLIRGSPDTAVNIEVNRAGSPLEFNIIRKTITMKYAYGELVNGNIGYIKITSFGATLDTDFANAYNSFAGKATGLVIDLRGNGGGYLNEATSLASLFLANGKTIIWIKDKVITEAQTASSDTKINLPVVILIDSGSASASEVLTAALVDNGVATTVGDKSYGKGTIQIRQTLSDASHLYVTTAEFLGPNKETINAVGIAPSVAATFSGADFFAGNDSQLQIAYTEIAKKAATASVSTIRPLTVKSSATKYREMIDPLVPVNY